VNALDFPVLRADDEFAGDGYPGAEKVPGMGRVISAGNHRVSVDERLAVHQSDIAQVADQL